MGTRLQVGVMALAWGVIAVCQGVVTFFVDDRFQAFREWEYAKVGVKGNRAPFCAQVVWDATSHGDLSHLVGVPQLRHSRHQRFTTDEYGYRNPVGTLDRKCEVVIVGDSAGVGSQASDDETLTGLIRLETSLGVYNAAGVPSSWFFGDRRFVDHPPRQVILVVAERYVGTEDLYSSRTSPLYRPRARDPSQVAKPMPIDNMRSVVDLLAALNTGRALRPAAEPVFKGLLYALGLFSLPPEIAHHDVESGMLFLAKAVDRHLNPASTTADIDRASGYFEWFDRTCRLRGLELLVVVVPEKETVYSELVPALDGRDVGAGLRRLSSALDEAGVAQVDILNVFEAYRRQHPDALLYYPDDTHLNTLGHRVVFEALRDRLPDRADPPALRRDQGVGGEGALESDS